MTPLYIPYGLRWGLGVVCGEKLLGSYLGAVRRFVDWVDVVNLATKEFYRWDGVRDGI